MRACRRIYSEGVGAIGPSEKKDILMETRELSREALDGPRPFELDDLEKMIERYDARRTIGEILDYVMSTTLKYFPKEAIRRWMRNILKVEAEQLW